jgi:serine acetyltransferase
MKSTQYALLKDDLIRLRSISIDRSSFLLSLIDVGFISVFFYRCFRAWRLSALNLTVLRAFLEKLVELFLKVHLPSGLDCGGGLVLIHGHGTIINSKARIGENATIYHRVTVGVRFPGDQCPVLGNNVVLASGCGVFGPVVLADNTIVKANQILTPRNFGDSK